MIRYIVRIWMVVYAARMDDCSFWKNGSWIVLDECMDRYTIRIDICLCCKTDPGRIDTVRVQ